MTTYNFRYILTAFASAILLAPPSMAQETQQAPTALHQEDAPSSINGAGNLMCPVTTDEEADASFFTIYKNRRIDFCCKRCRTKFEANPQAYLSNLPEGAFTSVSHQQDLEPEAEHEHNEPVEHSHEDEPAEHADDNHAKEHDHETDHGSTEDGFELLPYVGRFHVLAVHFPIALISIAALLELASMFKLGRTEKIVRILIAFGALGALASMSLGLANSIKADYNGTLEMVFWWHRALGITTATMALVTWVAVEQRVRRPTPSRGNFARATILLTALLVTITGHLGGSLVFGWNYLLP